MHSRKVLAFSFFFVLLAVGQQFAQSEMDGLTDSVIKLAVQKLQNSVSEIADSTRYPTYGSTGLKWKLKGSDQWTSGFYPGCLWYVYELSGNKNLARQARRWTTAIEKEKNNRATHDLGFRFMCSFGNALKFAKQKDTLEFSHVMLTAAQTFSDRFDEKIGCFSSNWDKVPIENSFPVVIDIMANLNLMYWAAENGGPARYRDMALIHARSTIRDFIRSDGGTYHIVRYDAGSGKIINKGTLQGAGDETTWARGQAWMIYGLVETYQTAPQKDILEALRKVTDYFLNNLPEDRVAPWDFDSDIDYRDVSASAIVCAALFKLSTLLQNDELSTRYYKEAIAMLKPLCKPPYLIKDESVNCLLHHSVHYLPINSNVDVPAIFADYYFLEALSRYKQNRSSG